MKTRKPGRPFSGRSRKINTNICLSAEALNALNKLAERLELSRSALIEKLVLEKY